MAQRQLRMTIPTQLVLRALLDEPARAKYGLEIGTSVGLPSGTVHPMLARLENLGWVASEWEDVDPRVEKRPARRYYRLTDSGLELARDALARSYQGRRRIALPRPATEST